MIKILIKIRAKQVYRSLYGIGFIRSIFLLVLLCIIGIFLFLASKEDKTAYYITGFFLLVLTLIQTKRKDKVFLKTHFAKYHHIFQIEYLLLVLPLIICLLYHSKWLHLTILIIGSFLISYINYIYKKHSFNTKLQKIIPCEIYEWKAGSRKLMFIIIPLWIIGLFTSFFIGSVPIVILIIGICLLNLYEHCEPYQMIIASEINSRKFLNQKIRLNTLILTFVLIPLVVAFVIFHVEYWYIVVAEYLLFISLHIYFILTKYAYYKSNEKPISAQIINILGTISIIIPVFLPVVWLLSVIFYFNALKTLNYYLHDFN